MTAHKMPPEFVDLVVRLDDVEGGRRVVTECGLTARITFPGMAQGEVLSPKKFVVSQDPLVRWLSKYGRGKKVWMKWGGEVRQVTVVSLHFCDDMVVYGQSLEDLQHNLGLGKSIVLRGRDPCHPWDSSRLAAATGYCGRHSHARRRPPPPQTQVHGAPIHIWW